MRRPDAAGNEVDKTLDIKGLASPRAVLVTMSVLEKVKKGGVLRVITNDAGTRQSIPSLCRQQGYEVLEMTEDSGTICFTIRK